MTADNTPEVCTTEERSSLDSVPGAVYLPFGSMILARQRLLRLAGPILLIGLLLVPVVAGAHHHAAHSATQPCATCAVTQHTPAVSVPVVSVPASSQLVVRVEVVGLAAPVVSAVGLPTSRGPPTILLALEA